MKLVKRRSGGLMEMRGLHEPDSSQRSQLHHSPMSWYEIAPRPSRGHALTLAGNGVRWSPPTHVVRESSGNAGAGRLAVDRGHVASSALSL
eukprot:3140770-Prymnesium_polylepis.1